MGRDPACICPRGLPLHMLSVQLDNRKRSRKEAHLSLNNSHQGLKETKVADGGGFVKVRAGKKKKCTPP